MSRDSRSIALITPDDIDDRQDVKTGVTQKFNVTLNQEAW
jgi:hypothetical protein